MPVTVVVLTMNEEGSLPGCLASLDGVTDDVHVLDSGSTDGTVYVAREAGVPIHVNPFRGFGTQRNWAIDHIPHDHKWVFHLDADERFTPELADELRALLDSDPAEAGFHVPSRLMLGGRWLRYSGGFPTYQVRLFRPDRLRFRDYGHGQREVTDGMLGFLSEPYLHDAFAKGLDEWFAKHARYARAEADRAVGEKAVSAADLFSSDRVRRRRALKVLSYRLPGRPTLRFWETLLLRRGLLDGRAGWTYARMLAAYEAMTAVHLGRRAAGFDL